MSLFDWLTIIAVEIFLVAYIAGNFDSLSQFLAQLSSL